jgi:hypothetical protein
MERQSDGHTAEEGVVGFGEFDRFGIGELPAGVLAHVGEIHGLHQGLSPRSGMLLTRLPPSDAVDEGERS